MEESISQRDNSEWAERFHRARSIQSTKVSQCSLATSKSRICAVGVSESVGNELDVFISNYGNDWVNCRMLYCL